MTATRTPDLLSRLMPVRTNSTNGTNKDRAKAHALELFVIFVKIRNFAAVAVLPFCIWIIAATHAVSAAPLLVDDFNRPDALYHGAMWETLTPGDWKIEDGALRRRLSNVGDGPAADVLFTYLDGRPIQGIRSLADGRVPLHGLIDVLPSSKILMTSTNGSDADAQVIRTLPTRPLPSEQGVSAGTQNPTQ